MAFGGFGSNNNSGFGGFGSSNTGNTFGANNAASSGSLFGGNTATAGAFGGFGANNNTNNNNSSPFGAAKPAFGASTTGTGGSLFGNNAASTATTGGFGSGGFGNTANTGGFGSSTSGGLFGQQPKPTPAFGATNTGGSLFGGGNNASTGGFGSSTTTANNPFQSNTTPGFGASATGNTFGFGATSTAANNNNSGTANTPFNAFTEREQSAGGGSTGSTSQYQSITFQQPYINKSFEELRTEDYAQGRKTGNTNGQAGGFGQSTGFGGFGASNPSTGGGLFGNNTAASNTSGFGASNTTNNTTANTNTFGGFGATNNTSGGLFGNKPAGGLFGAAATSTAPATAGFGSTTATGGGLFGNAGNTFGANNNNNNNGSSLFGASNTQQQNKPAFGGFGATNTSTAFGANSNTGGSLFGNNNNNNAGAAGGLFGQQNTQQQAQTNPFGGANNNTSGGLFGSQNKAAGSLFGNTNTAASTATGGGLFGAQNTQQQSGAFGQPNSGTSLFGNQVQNKPVGTSLFGASTNTGGGGLFGAQNNSNTGTSLFGGNNNNNNTNTGTSLFGSQNKPSGGSLFGNNNNNTTSFNGGGSLFGNTQQSQSNNAGGSLFGSMNQNANQQNTNNNSLFGGSFGQSQQPAQNQLQASLTGAPYGNEQLFSSLAAPSPPIGPLATPLSGARPAPKKTPSLLATARVTTPGYSPRASSISRNTGYGFSYSTYGTPGSAFTAGSLTPGASSLLNPSGSFGSALGGRLSKSFSTSNLRNETMPGDGRSLLRPNAFSPEGTPGRYSNGNVRKLKIDRSLRSDLFGPGPKALEAAKEGDTPSLGKRVSFESSTEKDAASPEVTSANALVRTEDREERASPGLLRAGPSQPRPTQKAPEMEQVNGALTSVPEDAEAPRASSAPAATASKATTEKSRKGEAGDYWTKPAVKDLRNMSRQQLKNVGNFTVGRTGVGRIEFGQVDLTNTPLEDICGSIVQLNPRSATVYQDDQDKPAMGKALNVPSMIYLDNSWPRSQGGRKPMNLKSGREYDKHIARLKRVAGTQFQNYDPDTGIWCFKVDHFTTYGLDDDDDESEFADDSRMDVESSMLSDAPDFPTEDKDASEHSVGTETGEMDDTFQFKLDRRSQMSLPGGFESEGMVFEDDPHHVRDATAIDTLSRGDGDADMEDPFVTGGPVQVPSPGAIERYHSSMIEDDPFDGVTEPDILPGSFIEEAPRPRPILKPTPGFGTFVSPQKLATDSWEEQLQRTMSPRKGDRQVLKEMQQNLMDIQGDAAFESPFKKSMFVQGQFGRSALGQSYLAQKSAKKANGMVNNGGTNWAAGESQAFRTAMDLMDSMYASDKTGQRSAANAGTSKYPHTRSSGLTKDRSDNDAAWHDSMKPNFASDGTLIYATASSAPQVSGELSSRLIPLAGEDKDVRFAKFTTPEDLDPPVLWSQNLVTNIDISSGFPFASPKEGIVFASLAERVDTSMKIAPQERNIWHLCSILHDELEYSCGRFMQGVPKAQIGQFESRMRMDALGVLWADLIAASVQDGLKRARSAEEKALLYLTQNDVGAACDALVEGRCFKLATLVAQLPGSERSRTIMKSQVEVWRERNDWSEMSEPVRALYSILAGEMCIVAGKSGAAEDRVAEFNISEKFGLSWRQSFALRLFFGGYVTINSAVAAYMSDLEAGRERVAATASWPGGLETGDILLQLLQLKIGEQSSSKLFDPAVVSGSPVNTRLTWQLALILESRECCKLSSEDLDRVTFAFGTELENAGMLTRSAWVLLHIRDPRARQRAIALLLERNGDRISTPSAEGSKGTFEELTQDIQIPSSMAWLAKALHAKAGLQDPGLQAQWLLRAGDADAAHEVLCTIVGPQAVIERDYDLLAQLLQCFGNRRVDGWGQGGQIYVDFLRLVKAQQGHKYGKDVNAATKRLRRALDGGAEATVGRTLEQRVAFVEMGKVLDTIEDGERDQPVAGAFSRPDDLGHNMWRSYKQAMAMSV